LACNPVGFHPDGGIDRVVGAAKKEIKVATDLPARGKLTLVPQTPRGIEERARIEIKDRLGIGLIPGAWIVAAQHQQIAHAGRCGAQQIALQRNAIAIAAGQLKEWALSLLDKSCGRRDRAKMRSRTGGIGHVHGVREAFQWKRLR
jgi:hypothetical protein